MEADFVIIGSGSSGSVLADRLSANGRYTVLILEYGGGDRSPLIRMPAALPYPMSMSRYDWGYVTEPEPMLGGRRLACPRGKVIGGSSSINGMVYVRGHRGDYDHWQEMGATGWAYDDVLPYFRRLECWHEGGQGGDSTVRGDSGPLHVTRGTLENPLFRAFIEAGGEAGYPITADYNGRDQEGFGVFDRTIWRGQRWSAANAYLKPALQRDNVTLYRCFARRILFANKAAYGVEIERNGAIETVKARREIILSASSINSPKILQLSGIGPADHLRSLAIPVIADRSGVGANLQDHLEVCVQQACRQPVSLYRYWSLWGKAWVGMRWLLSRSGVGASNHFESGAFIRSRDTCSYPDVEIHFMPIAVRYDGAIAAAEHGFQAHVGPMRSQSRGTVRLATPDPAIAPRINFNYMSHPDDWRDFRRCITIARKVFSCPALSDFSGREISPGANVQSDDALDDFIRSYAESSYHPCGTCRMGAVDAADSVVDPQCRVIGVEGLRVIDSSIFPRILYGNLNAPSMMVGEKGADHILAAIEG